MNYWLIGLLWKNKSRNIVQTKKNKMWKSQGIETRWIEYIKMRYNIVIHFSAADIDYIYYPSIANQMLIVRVFWFNPNELSILNESFQNCIFDENIVNNISSKRWLSFISCITLVCLDVNRVRQSTARFLHTGRWVDVRWLCVFCLRLSFSKFVHLFTAALIDLKINVFGVCDLRRIHLASCRKSLGNLSFFRLILTWWLAWNYDNSVDVDFSFIFVLHHNRNEWKQ